MLKRRLIPKLQLRRSGVTGRDRMVLVTSIQYSDHIEIGDPISQAKIYQNQAADELIFVDVDASREGRRSISFDIIHKVAEEMFMPLTVGGGVRTIDDFRMLLLNGADKVSINTSAVECPDMINNAANIYGAQCVVLSIDFKRTATGSYKVWTKCGTQPTDIDPVEWAKEGERRGSGEILLSSIDRDGTRRGLEIEVIKKVTEAVSIPVIASGGCGLASHFVDGFIKGNADAVSAGTHFCFRDENLMQIRSQIKNAGIPIRLHT